MQLKIITTLFLYCLIINGLAAQKKQSPRLKLVDSLYQQLKKVDSDAQKTSIYFQLLQPKNKVKKYHKKIIAEALNVAKRTAHKELAALAYLRGSLDLINQGQYQQANLYLKNAYDYYSKHAPNKNLVTSLILRGYYFHRQNYSTEALKTYLKALPLAKELKDLKRINNLYNRIVNIYVFQKKYEKALHYAYQIKKNCAGQDVLKCPFYSNSLHIIGSFYLEMNQLDSARHYIQLTYDNYKSPVFRQGVYANIALLHQKEGRLPQALVYADSSLQSAIKTKKPLAAANMHFLKADIYAALGNTAQEIYNLEQQIAITNEHQFAKKKMQALDRLSQIFKAKNDYTQAYYYAEDWRVMKDSLAEVERTNLTKRYDELLAEYEKEEQLQSLKESQLIQQNQKNILLAVSLFLVLFLGLAGFFLHIRKQLNTALQGKNKLLNIAVKEREMLIKEVHHRVKNNLQIITSLLNLQMRHLRHPEAKEALKDSQNRIKSMALIHQNLYQEMTLTGVHSRTYIQHLLRNIQSSFIHKEIEIEQKIDDVLIAQEPIVLLGLVINEAITNIYKHAFPDHQEGFIQFSFEKKEQQILLHIEDNGIGLPKGIQVDTHHSFGLQLIQDIAVKLKADYQFNNKEKGAILQMNIPFEKMTVNSSEH